MTRAKRYVKCPHCDEHAVSDWDLYKSLLFTQTCEKCGERYHLKVPYFFEFALLYFATPLWLFWIFFPVIPASPTQLFYALGLGPGVSVTLGTIVLFALYGVVCVLFGHAVKAKH